MWFKTSTTFDLVSRRFEEVPEKQLKVRLSKRSFWWIIVWNISQLPGVRFGKATHGLSNALPNARHRKHRLEYSDQLIVWRSSAKDSATVSKEMRSPRVAKLTTR